MSHTIHYILFPHRSHCLHYQRLVAILPEAGQLLGAQRLELALDLREHQLDWVVLRAERNVKDPTKAELLHGRASLLRFVNRELVHEDGDLLVAGRLPQLPQVLLELRDVY